MLTDFLALLEAQLAAFAGVVDQSFLAEWMRLSLKAMPIVEAIHVMAVAVIFGTILVVDLRLMGLTSRRRSARLTADEMTGFTWAAFGVAVLTGVLMFAPNALTYYDNTMFRYKLLAIFLAGVNMAWFERSVFPRVGRWDRNVMPPFSARLAGALSILIWTTVIIVARWIGFTKGYDFDIPEVDENLFDFGADIFRRFG